MKYKRERTGTMNFKTVLYVCFISLLPLDGTGYVDFNMGFLHVSILDLLLVALSYLVFLESAVAGFKIPRFTQKISLLLVIASLVSLVSFFYISSEYLSYDIKISLNFLEFAALVIVSSNVIKDELVLKKVMLALCISTFIIAILTVLKSVGVPVPGYVRLRYSNLGPFYVGVVGLMGRVMGFSIMACSVSPFLFGDVIIKARVTRIVLTGCIIVASIISYTRSLWVALAGQVLMFLFIFLFERDRKLFKKFSAGVVLTGLVLALILFAGDVYEIFMEMRPETLTRRMTGYFHSINLAVSGPVRFLFGSGKGHFMYWYGEEGGMPHNFILDLLISKGLITVLVVVVVFYLIMVNYVRLIGSESDIFNQRVKDFVSPFLVALTGSFLLGMTAPITTSIIFWTLIAICTSFIAMVREREN